MNQLNIPEIAALAVACPTTALVVEGPPGCGKTVGLTAELEKADYQVLRIDAQNVAPEFLAALPLIDHKTGTVKFVSHNVWTPSPRMAIMVDELFKASKHVVDAFLTLVFGNEFMGHKYKPETIRIITANNAEFGLGDRELPHMGNRTCRVQVAPMTVTDAKSVMAQLSFDARILRWAESNPAALASWDEKLAAAPDTEKAGYYGYDPRHPRQKFVSMRSLEMASNYLKAGLSASVLDVALTGAIGRKAAVSLSAFMAENREYVSPAAIRANPLGVALPKRSYELREMVVGLALACQSSDTKWLLGFLARLDGEYARLFCHYASYKAWIGASSGDTPAWDAFLREFLE